MRINKFFMGLGAVAALSLAACSNDEPVNNGNTGDAEFGDQYITVSVMMPTSNGGRADSPYGDGEGQIPADNGNDKYDKGEVEESTVTNAVFIFFDTNKNVVDIQRFTDVEWTNTEINNNPYVNKYGEKDIRLKAGLDYSWVAVLLNSDLEVGILRARIKDLASLEAYAARYVEQIKANGSNQMMSNSVYFETESRTVKPEENQKVILVPITEDNKYQENEDYEPVEIYVERVVARVDVEMALALNNDNTVKDFHIGSSDTNNKLTLYNNVTFTQSEVEIVPVLNGVMLDVLTPTCKLVKPIEVGAIGYVQNANNYNAFQWNDPLNKRSYWATTSDFEKNSMQYFSWNNMEGRGLSSFKQYVHPNTQQFEPLANGVNEDRSMNSKVVVAATLMYKEDGDDELKPLDLVRYGAEYMFASNFMSQVASVANTAVRGIDWATASIQGNEEEGTVSFTPTEATVLQVAVNNSFLGYERVSEGNYVWVGLEPNMFGLDKKVKFDKEADVNDYESVVVGNNPTWTINWNKELFNDYNDDAVKALLDDGDALAALAEKADPFIENAITSAIDNLNEPRILHWNEGKTYYYYVIRHQGFYGLAGNGADNFVYGLVRNHIYDVQLQALYGLGTPVINPGEPIDPERPNDEEPTYIEAKINILPWRVVKNNATLH